MDKTYLSLVIRSIELLTESNVNHIGDPLQPQTDQNHSTFVKFSKMECNQINSNYTKADITFFRYFSLIGLY